MSKITYVEEYGPLKVGDRFRADQQYDENGEPYENGEGIFTSTVTEIQLSEGSAEPVIYVCEAEDGTEWDLFPGDITDPSFAFEKIV